MEERVGDEKLIIITNKCTIHNHPKLRRHSRRICSSESGCDLVWCFGLRSNFWSETEVWGKGKGERSIAVRKKPHRYGNSRAIWDHTVLPATRQRWQSRLYPNRSWYSIKRPRRDARLSWSSWLVTARDGIFTRRRSPIPVVTGPDVR